MKARTSGEFGVRYQMVDRRGVTTRERFFPTYAKLTAFIETVRERPTFYQILATTAPRGDDR